MSSSSSGAPLILFLLETDRAGDLQGESLERRSIREFLKVLETQARLPSREGRVHCESERVDGVALLRCCRSDVRPGLARRLTLFVPGESDLKVQLLRAREGSHERIIEVEGLARMNAGA